MYINANLLAPLFLFVMVSVFSPGPTNTLAAVSGSHLGYRKTRELIISVSICLGVMVALSGLGLATLLLTMPGITLLLKIAGSLYLLWLAWKTACKGAPANNEVTKPVTFVGGAWLQLNNPKGWAMALGANASFVGLVKGPLILATLLGVIFTVAAVLSLSLWCLAGHLLARQLTNETQWRVLNGILALLLIISIASLWL